MRRSSPQPRASQGTILTKAVLRAAEILNLKQADLAEVLGVSPATVSRMGSGRTLEPDTKEGELALLFLRVFRSLDAVIGGDKEKVRSWFWSENTHLSGIPVELIRTIEGLTRVAGYLDAVRGHL